MPETELMEIALAGATSVSVGDITGLDENDYSVIGPLGVEGTEMREVGTITDNSYVVDALSNQHDANTPVKKSLWSKIQVATATTIGGSKTEVETVDIQWSRPYTEVLYDGTDGYIFSRYENDDASEYSEWSDAVPLAGYGADTVRGIVNAALDLTGAAGEAGITDNFLFREITNCEIDLWRERRQWPYFDVNDYPLGRLAAGEVIFAMPSDISDPDTSESVRTVRVRGIPDLRKITREEFDRIRWDMAYSYLADEATSGATTLTFDSVADFTDPDGNEATGSVGSDTFTYTGIDYDTNELSGVSGITATWPVGQPVWQGANVEDIPALYTVMDRQIVLPLPPAANYVNRAVTLNYYSKPVYPTSDAELVNFPDPTLYQNWLCEKIEMKRHNGSTTDASLAYKKAHEASKRKLLGQVRVNDGQRAELRSPRRQQQRNSILDNYSLNGR